MGIKLNQIIEVEGFNRMKVHSQISKEKFVLIGRENNQGITLEIDFKNIIENENGPYSLKRPYEIFYPNSLTYNWVNSLLEDLGI